MCACVMPAFAVFVFFEAGGEIVRDSGIKTLILTKEDINKPHVRSLLRRIYLIPSGEAVWTPAERLPTAASKEKVKE